ncbi:MAG: hypothetical protein EOO29_32460 [Comamonadaceae bacterium]|nr:MAG: hypothetical protein EOO29_32460 [Comamonadaceae bacterium]
MRTSPLLNTQHRQAQIHGFAPRLQHAVRLLNMSALEYAQALLEEAAQNPFLDMEAAMPQPDAEGTYERAAWTAPPPTCARRRIPSWTTLQA